MKYNITFLLGLGGNKMNMCHEENMIMKQKQTYKDREHFIFYI